MACAEARGASARAMMAFMVSESICCHVVLIVVLDLIMGFFSCKISIRWNLVGFMSLMITYLLRSVAFYFSL